MRDVKEKTTGLTMTWVPVRDPDGRVRMEASWVPTATPIHKPHPHAA